MPLYLWIVIFSLIGGVFSLLGGVVLLFKENWVKKNTLIIISWSAGVLLAVSFLDLFPEALEMGAEHGLEPRSLFVWPFLAMVIFFTLERTLVWFHHHHDFHAERPTNLLLLLGDSLHNFIDGIVITAAFLVSVPTGIVTAIAVAAHEIPQEIADFGIFLKSGMKKGKVFVVNLLSALATLVGALVAMKYLAVVEAIQAQLLAFAAGMFVYIAASDLIPELHHEESTGFAFKQVIAFGLGIVVTYVLVSVTHV